MPSLTDFYAISISFASTVTEALLRQSIYRLLVPGAAVLLYILSSILWLSGKYLTYFEILRLFAFEPFGAPFLDIHGVLSAAECHRLGIDVYAINPCDLLWRVHAYSPLWLRLVPAWLGTRDTPELGLVLDLAFIYSLSFLCRPTRIGEVVALALTALSPMTVYALERANNDLLIFLLILCGCGLLQLRRAFRFAGYFLFLFAGLLKYYPLILLVLVLRERRRDAIALAFAALVILGLAVLGFSAEIGPALADIPKQSYFAGPFAAVNLPLGFAQLLTAPRCCASVDHLPAAAGALLCALAVMVVARIGRSLRVLGAGVNWHGFEADCLAVGALLLTGCFFAGQNVEYRGIYFVLVMPGLVDLRRRTVDPRLRGFLAMTMVGVLIVAWAEVLRRIAYFGLAPWLSHAVWIRASFLCWFGRELLWWWLIAGLAALALAYLRQLPLVAAAAGRLAQPGRSAPPLSRRQPG